MTGTLATLPGHSSEKKAITDVQLISEQVVKNLCLICLHIRSTARLGCCSSSFFVFTAGRIPNDDYLQD